MLYPKLFTLTHPSVFCSITKQGIHLTGAMSAKVAVVLSGCGLYDGSEIHEASAILVHLSRNGANVSMFAPDINQMHAIDHIKGKPMEPNRNVLVESARIARGNISALSKLKANDFDAVIFPGGFGAAKNLSTFAVDGASMKVNEDVQRVLKDFHGAGKPIGLCCISPVLAAKVIQGSEVTVGADGQEAAKAIQSMGSKHIGTKVNESHIDKKNNIVTTAAFMCEAALHEIFDGIGKMVTDVIKQIKK